MTTIVLTGGDIITAREVRYTNLCLDSESGKIVQLTDEIPQNCQQVDVSGCYVTPGLFDLQVNGGPECNLWADPQPEALKELRQSLAESGVTSFLPTLITDDVEHLKKNLKFLESQGAGSISQDGLVSRMPGVHLEGPFLSLERPGVHPPEHIKDLAPSLMEQVIGPSVKLVTLAPEKEASGKTIDYLHGKDIVVSLGHSNATFEEANTAFDRGVSLITHTFNALPPLHHRSLGAVGAALLDDRVTCCMICDGLHLSAPAARLIYRMKGCELTVLVSDAAYTGTSQGGLVGSSIKLTEAVRNVVKWNICDFPTAIRMASYNPARVMKIDDRIGELKPGALADVVVWNKQDLSIKQVFVGGKGLS